MQSTEAALHLAKSPIKLTVLEKFLADYPDKSVAQELLCGFKFGFRLQYDGPRTDSFCSNLKSVIQNPSIAWTKVKKEIKAGRIAGPFTKKPLENLRISPIGIVPKKNGSWRLIQHLSYPEGSSLNDFIDSSLCSVKYTSIDQVTDSLTLMGSGALLGKIDIENAFRILPVYPDDFNLLGFTLNNFYFIDKCLPMGCALSCSLFEKLASFLEWLTRSRSNKGILHHYLDDYIFLGRKNSTECFDIMCTFSALCCELGVPLSEDKTVWPTEVLSFIGFELNSLTMQLRIPAEKISKVSDLIRCLLSKKKTTLREFQSLVGLLNFCSRAIPCARAFNRRFYDAMCNITKPHHHLRLTNSIKEDLRIWLMFSDLFNGYCIFPELEWLEASVLHLYTDSAGSNQLGCAAIFGNHWVFLHWPSTWFHSSLMADLAFLELVPIVLAFHTWASSFKGKKIMLHTDNQALVTILNKKSSRSKFVMHLLRPFVLHLMLHNIQIKAVHVFGFDNGIADSVSRMQWKRFRQLAPDADLHPTQVRSVF